MNYAFLVQIAAGLRSESRRGCMSYSFRSRTQLRSSGSAPPASPEFCASITGPAFSALSSNSIDPHTATSATLRRRAELPEAGVTYVSDQENLN